MKRHKAPKNSRQRKAYQQWCREHGEATMIAAQQRAEIKRALDNRQQGRSYGLPLNGATGAGSGFKSNSFA